MKILLLGRDGQVGRELWRSLTAVGHVVAYGRSDADFARLEKLENLVRSVQPDVIVNAAAYTAVDKAESEPDLAARVNADAVALLARITSEIRAWLFHYSSDYVFDGRKSGAYRETDVTHPLNVYGRTKLAGEDAIRVSGCRHAIFRTSWVYGVHGRNFVKTMLRLARERTELKVVADQHGAPTSARLIADVTACAIPAALNGVLPSGTYHLAPSGETTWHGLARSVVTLAIDAGMSLRLGPDEVLPIPSTDYPTPAARPMNSRLDTSRLAGILGLKLPEWQDDVADVVLQLAAQEVVS